jgi:transcriptional antiterminator RfaH
MILTNGRDLLPEQLEREGVTLAWFCVRSQLKHEHIAAANLRVLPQTEVFNPRIRFKRPTRRGPVWVTESLFPNYLFARFDWRSSLRLIHHTGGVAGIVHFGSRWPTIPDTTIEELRSAIGEDQLRIIDDSLEIGQEVRISGGAFDGLEGVITRIVPARQRVAVLLDFLGRQTAVEVPADHLVKLNSSPGLR